MLSKNDLKSIGDLIDERIDERLDAKLDEKLEPLKTDVSELKTDVSGLKTDVSELKTDVSKLKTDVSELKTDVSELKTDVSGLKQDVSKIKTEIKAIKTNNVRVENKLDEMKLTFEANLKKWKSELFDKIDPILTRVTIAEDENVILKAREKERLEIKDELEDYGNRIEKLEQKVFHTTA